MKIEAIKFGSITLDGKRYHEILIISGQVEERDCQKLNQLFGTSHQMGDWEKRVLLSGSPEAIIIGDGFQGVFQTPRDLVDICQDKNIQLIVSHTPFAVAQFNQLVAQKKKVNALFHTTC